MYNSNTGKKRDNSDEGKWLFRKTKTKLIHDIKRYEERFEDEYSKFVSEMEEK
ncbi:MAG: hypothetical protein Q8M95_15635 [Candidatus Methanoperedens sp.]|nr:hypothetical protein [Candidatus Methanoperedens sp.]